MNYDIAFNILCFFSVYEVAKYFCICSYFNFCDNNILWNYISHRDIGIEIDKQIFVKYKNISPQHIKQLITIFNSNPQCQAIDTQILENKRSVIDKSDTILLDYMFERNVIYNKFVFNTLFSIYNNNNRNVFKKELKKKKTVFVMRDGTIKKLKYDINFYNSIFIHILYMPKYEIKQLKLMNEYTNYFKYKKTLDEKIYKLIF